MNKGIGKATGSWIIFMNAGDIFASNDTIKQVFFRREYASTIGVIHGLMYWGQIQPKNLLRLTPFFLSKKKLRGMGISHQAIFTRTELAKKYLFDLSFKVAADYDMMMKIYQAGWEFRQVDIPVVIYDTSGYSAQNAMLQLKEEARICQMEHHFCYRKEKMKLYLKQIIKKILRL